MNDIKRVLKKKIKAPPDVFTQMDAFLAEINDLPDEQKWNHIENSLNVHLQSHIQDSKLI